MRPFIPQIHEKGAELVLVGSGAPHFISAFREDTGFQGPIYTDPSLASYRAAELNRGVVRTLGPRAAVNATRAFFRGFRQKKLQGDAFQQGGVLVIHPPAELRYRYASQVTGDHPNPREALAAL
ncbi:MAG: peroxiredoxin-like family protein [Deltaproteobacteria bacterium]